MFIGIRIARREIPTKRFGLIPARAWRQSLGPVDKFDPEFDGGQVEHAEEAVGQLVVTGCD